MLKIIHCLTDEKFAKEIIRIFDFLNDRCENIYIHIKEFSTSSYQFISDIEEIEHVKACEFLNVVKESHCNVVVLHNLYSLPISIVSKIPQNIKVVWFAWGFDIYTHFSTKPFINVDNIYHEETKKLITPTIKERIQKCIRYTYKCFQKKRIEEAISRIDFFSGILPEEYNMMKENSFFKAKSVEFRYADPNDNISIDSIINRKSITGKNILIGNSGDPSNNHVDIFKKLKPLNLENRKIFVPLSYAGTNRYKKEVKEIGYDYWGDNFIPLENFMPISEYQDVLSSCGYRIFGHERQQAMGNIGMSFREGCMVYLSETSILYEYYKKYGMKARTIQHDLNQDGIDSFDSPEQILLTRRNNVEYYSSEKQKDRLYRLIKDLENSF